MSEYKNSLTDIKKYLSTSESPVSNEEFTEFWKSLSEEEKIEFKNADLPKE